MKQRNDFVSNSSSSSFIVINDTGCIEPVIKIDDEPVSVPSYNGNYQFGWSFQKYNSFWDKLNFCAIQLLEIKGFNDTILYWKKEKDSDKNEYIQNRIKRLQEWIDKFDQLLDMLKKVCKEKFGIDVVLNDNIGLDSGQIYAYIDHQSSVSEGVNMEMFESENSLYNFLASEDSYIKTGNDNEDAPEGWDFDR